MTSVDRFTREGLIEHVPVDENMAQQWLADAERHLRAADQIADIDPSGAYLAYDAARKALAAALLRTGHRVLARPGSHRALAVFAPDLSRTDAERTVLESFDDVRRNRNRSEYGRRSFGSAEVDAAVRIATQIVEIVRQHN